MIFLFLYMSCISIPEKYRNSANSVIAVSLNVDVPEGTPFVNTIFTLWVGYSSVSMIFIKLNSLDDSLNKDEIYISNFNNPKALIDSPENDRHSFLLDAPPGIYAIVAAYGESVGSQGKYPPDHILFFPKEMIKSSIIKVEAGNIAYMGTYTISNCGIEPNIVNTDSTQRHYYQLMYPKKDGSGKAFARYLKSRYKDFYIPCAPKMLRVQKSSQDEKKFWKEHLYNFKKSSWYNNVLEKSK